MKILKNIFTIWIIIIFLVTFTSILTYLAAQQVTRLGANEQPAQLAVETSINLKSGQSIKDAIPSEVIDISKSLRAFVMIYDKNKILVASSGMLGKDEPVYPKGVLDNLDKIGSERVTWQPQAGLRFATVALKTDNNYIVAAYSLLERENLIDVIGELILAAWLACIIFSSIALGIVYFFIKKVFRIKNS
jgi:hypothetical protein